MLVGGASAILIETIGSWSEMRYVKSGNDSCVTNAA